jgi:hypothetical protein
MYTIKKLLIRLLYTFRDAPASPKSDRDKRKPKRRLKPKEVILVFLIQKLAFRVEFLSSTLNPTSTKPSFYMIMTL